MCGRVLERSRQRQSSAIVGRGPRAFDEMRCAVGPATQVQYFMYVFLTSAIRLFGVK